MKARTQEAIGQRVAKAEFDKHAEEYANHTAQSVIALVAYIMYSKWRCSSETCQKRVREIADMLNAPQIFGQDIHDTDYINWCKETLNLDVKSEVKLKVKVDYV